MKWIKCSERMPATSQKVIIPYRGSSTMAYFRNGKVFHVYLNRKRLNPSDVKFWMPLPQPPQHEVKSALEIGMSRYEGAMQKLAEGGD